MRYAAYVRISSEDQVGNFSIDAQRRAIQGWVLAQEGVLVQTYVDEAQSGRKADRPGFQKMRRDARKGKFEALVVHRSTASPATAPTPWPPSPCCAATTASKSFRSANPPKTATALWAR